MKLLNAILLAAAWSLSCSHVVPVVKDCSAQAALSIIDDVNTALATDSWRNGLAALIDKFGSCVVEKAVAIVADQAQARAQYDELEATKAARAKQWLADRPAS